MVAVARLVWVLRLRGASELTRRGVRTYLTGMTTTVSSKGQIVLPAEIRRQDDIRSGEVFEVERVDRGEYVLRRKTLGRKGWVELLLACPAKGWFKPMDRRQTTDELPAPRFE